MGDVATNKEASQRLLENYKPTALVQVQGGSQREVKDIQKRTGASRATQIKHLSMRFLHKMVRHPVLATVNFAATIFIGILAGLLYNGISNDLEGAINRAGLFFFTLTYLMMAALADLGIWQDEQIIFMRERASGCYDATSFFIAKFFAEMLPLRVIPLSIFTMILTWGVGLNKEPEAVLVLFVVLLIVSLVSTLMFLSLGMLFRSGGTSNFLAVLLTMYSLLMSGFLLQFGDKSTIDGVENNGTSPSYSGGQGGNILQYLSVLYFAFEALMVSEMNGLSFELVVKNPDGVEITSVGASGDLILAQLGLDYRNYQRDVTALFVYLAVFFVYVTLLLKFIVYEKR